MLRGAWAVSSKEDRYYGRRTPPWTENRLSVCDMSGVGEGSDLYWKKDEGAEMVSP